MIDESIEQDSTSIINNSISSLPKPLLNCYIM